MENSAARTLYDLLVTRDFEPEILDAQGKAITDPGEAELFSFDWKTPERNYGTVVCLLGPDNDLQIYFGDNLGRGMEGEDKKAWYDFLAQIKSFATRNLLQFGVQDLSRLKYAMQGMAAIKEGLFEGYYGTRKVSYSDQPKKTRLMIRHSRDLGEGEARYRAIESLFVETADGERFRVPSRSLTHGRMLARHIAEGGTPYDAFGQHITQMVSEMATLAKFVRAARNRGFDGPAAEMTEAAIRHYADIKRRAKHMISQRGYREARDAFDPAEITDSEQMVSEIRDMFVEQSLDQRIEEALPILARLALPMSDNAVSAADSDDDNMKEAAEFESWADQITEGTWALPDTPEKQKRLQDLMNQELVVGPDAINATEQLYDLVGDDALFDILDDISNLDPDANAWADPRVQQRLSELGIELQQSEPAPAEEPPVQEAQRGRPSKFRVAADDDKIDNRDDGLPRIGKTVSTPTGRRHYARPERGGTIPEPDPLEKLDKQLISRLDRAFGVKYKSGGPKGVQLDEETAKFVPVKPRGTPPKEGDIHHVHNPDLDLLPGFRDNSTGEDYSDTYYYRDPISGGVFSVYTHSGEMRVRGTGGMQEKRVREIQQTLEQDMQEDLDVDGVMMTRPSNMSSESRESDAVNRLIELARI